MDYRYVSRTVKSCAYSTHTNENGVDVNKSTSAFFYVEDPGGLSPQGQVMNYVDGSHGLERER